MPDPQFYTAGWNIEEAVEGLFHLGQTVLQRVDALYLCTCSLLSLLKLGVLGPFLQQMEAVQFASFTVESQVWCMKGGGGWEREDSSGIVRVHLHL